MPSFCKPYALKSTQFVDARPHGEYNFCPSKAVSNRILLFCGKATQREASIRMALDALGQRLIDEQRNGVMSYREARAVFMERRCRKTANKWLYWLGACGAITELADAKRFAIVDFAKRNRTLAGWVQVREERRVFKRYAKRAERADKQQKQGYRVANGGLVDPPEVPNSAFVAVTVNSSKNPPPTPHSTPTPSLTGGVGQITKQQAPPPDPKPAGQDRVQNAGLEPMDVQGALSRLFAPAKPTSEAHPKALRQVFDAAPEPAQQVENDSQDNDEVFPDWCDPAKFRALSRARHGREVTEAYATEQLTPKSRPEVLKLERVPITPDELDAICAVPEPKRTQLLAGNYTRAEVKRVYEHAANDPDCRMPNRVLLSRLQSGQGRR